MNVMSPRKAAALRAAGDQNLRDHLVSSAERLLARNGTAGLTVRGIAREAQVADGVLYNHFHDKEELIALAVHAYIQRVESTLEESPRAGDGTVEANLHAYLTRGFSLHIAILPALIGLLYQPKILSRLHGMHNPMSGGRGLRAELADYLRAEQDLGRVSADTAVDAVATMLIGACHELVLPSLFSGSDSDEIAIDIPAGMIDDLVASVMSGIAPARDPAESP